MSGNDEIFEDEAADLKRLDKALGLDSDADDEEESLKMSVAPAAEPQETAAPVQEEPAAPKISKKTGRPKRQLTEAQRERNLANLAKGRAKGLETRRRKAQLRKMAREEKLTEEEKRIAEHLEKKKAKNRKHDELQEEINKLKAQLAEKNKSSMPISNNDTEKTTKAAKAAKEPKEPKQQAAKEKKEPKEKAKPPQANKPLSQKQLLKIMRQLR